MRRRLLLPTLLGVVAACLPGCFIGGGGGRPDPVHDQKLDELERRMVHVEDRLPRAAK
jgi:hypothetical protein